MLNFIIIVRNFYRTAMFPSTKSNIFMDGSTKMKLPSMKMSKIMDGSTKIKLPSMKTAEFMDGRYKKAPKVPKLRTFGADMLFSTT